MIEIRKNPDKAEDNFKVWLSSKVLKSTFVGLRNVLISQYSYMKLIWLISYFGFTVYMCYLISDSVRAYFNRDVIIKLRYDPDYQIDFPALAICELDQINRQNNTKPIDDILVSCRFNSAPCNLTYFGTIVSLTYGKCYTFNTHVPTRPLLRTHEAGMGFGLTLELYPGTPSQLSTTRTTGLAVGVFNASSRPSFSEEIFRVEPGQETSLMVSRRLSYKLSYPYSQCVVNTSDQFAYDSNEYRNTFNNTNKYRQKSCISLCSTNLFDLKAKSGIQLIRNTSECFKKCPEECHQIEYKIFQYFSKYPNDAYALELKKNSRLLANLSVKDVKKSMILLNVNYETMIATVTEETPAMPFATLLGNLGGQLGLFLGLSVISFVEIVEILVIVFWEYVITKICSPGIIKSNSKR